MKRAIFLCAALTASAALAQSYSYLDYRMLNSDQDPFHYLYNDEAFTPVGLDAGEAATTAAFGAWDGVPCASIGFQYDGRTSANAQIANPEDAFDSFSVSTTFISDAGDPYYNYALAGGVAYMTDVPLSYSGVVYQCDIYVNDVQDPNSAAFPKWSTDDPTPSDSLDLQTFLTHEVGHCMGLDHSLSGTTDVMRPDLGFGVELRTLSDHDVGQLCNYYPVDGGMGSPCPTGQCGSGFNCVSAPRPDGGSYPPTCTQACDPDAGTSSCPAPYLCKPSAAAGGSGACFPPDTTEVQIGQACPNGYSDCGGTGNAVCLSGSYPSGVDEWPDGYCSQDCTNDPCPAESTCTVFPDGNHVCLKDCRIGSGDCRSGSDAGYVCTNLVVDDAGTSADVCIGQCSQDIDCPTGFSCRRCDGMCIPNQNSTAQIGDPCTDTSQCGKGETCIAINGSTTGVCSQSCATVCGACPSGTTCHPIGGSGDLYCLRDCVTGTCPSGDQCEQLSTGNGCVPGCQSNSECLVGDVCSGGECVTPAPDAGCTPCSVDAGVPPPSDGGSGGGGGGGGGSSGGAFGCQSAPGGSPWAAFAWFFGLAFLLKSAASRRRQRVPER